MAIPKVSVNWDLSAFLYSCRTSRFCLHITPPTHTHDLTREDKSQASISLREDYMSPVFMTIPEYSGDGGMVDEQMTEKKWSVPLE